VTHDLSSLTNRLKYDFKNQALLNLALTHRSAGSRNNERLEFLGDAILGQVIAVALFDMFPAATEGELSRMRASLVKGETLAELSNEINLGDYLILGSGELKSGGFRRRSILADAFEAIIGAVYLDSNLETAKNYILYFMNPRLNKCSPETTAKDPKTRLQEYLQQQGLSLPEYTIKSTTGSAHEQEFEVECHVKLINEQIIGIGHSRRKAEQDAASKVLEILVR